MKRIRKRVAIAAGVSVRKWQEDSEKEIIAEGGTLLQTHNKKDFFVNL